MDVSTRGGSPRRGEVTFHTNDPEHRRVRLAVLYHVQAPVLVSHGSARLVGPRGTTLSGGITLRPGTNQEFEVLEARVVGDSARVVALVAHEDGSIEVLLRGLSREEPGTVRDTLRLRTRLADGTEHTKKVPVLLEHRDRVTHQPHGNVVFQRRDTAPLERPDAEPARRDITLFSTIPGFRFRVLSVEFLDVPEGLFSSEVRVIEEGERTVVSIFLRSTIDEPSVRGRVRIVTDEEGSPEKVLRLYAQFAEPPSPKGRVPATSGGILAPRGSAPPEPAPTPGDSPEPEDRPIRKRDP